MSTEPLPDETIAYVAGVLDARAHVEVMSGRGRGPQPRLSVTTRRLDLLEHLAGLTGTKISLDSRGYQRRPCVAHCVERHEHLVRQSAKWRVDCLRATIVLFNVQPFIVSQRIEVANALAVGLTAYPAARGNTAKQMAALGWALPEAQAKETVA